MKKNLTFLVFAVLAALGAVIISCTPVPVLAQGKPNPDTVITIKTTNNQLYRLNALFQVTAQNLLKSDMAVKDYIEFQKEYQALLQAWFKQKEEQDKASKSVKAAGK